MNTTPASLLMRLQQAQDQESWARFVDLYTPMIYAWGRRVGLQEPDAADLVQDVFTLLVQKLPHFSYDQHKSFRAWLRTVTLNKWRDRRKHRNEQQADAALLNSQAGADTLEAFWEAEYTRQLVARAWTVMQAEFRPATWQACWEFVAQNRPAAEIAKQLGITENAVYLAKHRVLRRLRRELDGLLE